MFRVLIKQFNAGVPSDFFLRHAAKLGNNYTFVSIDKHEHTSNPDLFRTPFVSGPGFFATFPQRFAHPFVDSCNKMGITFAHNRNGNKLWPIEGHTKIMNSHQLSIVLKDMEFTVALTPGHLSFHRNGECEEFPMVQRSSKQKTKTTNKCPILSHFGYDLPSEDVLITKMPMLYEAYLSLCAPPQRNFCGDYEWNCLNLDTRLHMLRPDGDEVLFQKHPDSRGRSAAIAGIAQTFAAYALHQSNGGCHDAAENFVTATEKLHGGSVQIHLTKGCNSKQGVPSHNRSNPPGIIMPTTMVVYCHNIVSYIKNSLGAFTIMKNLHSKISKPITYGQAMDLLKSIHDQMKTFNLHPSLLQTSIDVEVNTCSGGSGCVSSGTGGFYKYVQQVLKVLYENATNNSVHVSSIRTRLQRIQSSYLLSTQLTHSRYFYCSSRGRPLPDHKKVALLHLISDLGVTFGMSKLRNHLSTITSTHGSNAGLFRYQLDMNEGHKIRNIYDVLYAHGHEHVPDMHEDMPQSPTTGNVRFLCVYIC